MTEAIAADPLPMSPHPLTITPDPLSMDALRIRLSPNAEECASGAAAVTEPTKNPYAELVGWGRATSSDRSILYQVIVPSLLTL
ncbi:MAG: hypothetical protein KME43_22065 [Myxacorys chilensis ATA2-1-KO14]|nr:hypothetical protein [Myxacorys chilensis ATA2-1-KO14]